MPTAHFTKTTAFTGEGADLPTDLPWTPAQLPNLVAWFDAQSLGLADGAAVATWEDLSENGNDLVQATSGARPVVDIDKINGHPAVVADGVDDFLSVTLASDITTNPYTVIAMAGTDVGDLGSGVSNYLFSTVRTDAGNGASLYRASAEQYVLVRGSSNSSAGAAWTVGAKFMKVFVDSSSATSTLEVDGTPVALTGSTNTATMTVDKINLFTNPAASTGFGAMYVGEFLVVQGAVSSENLGLIAEYMNRWDAV